MALTDEQKTALRQRIARSGVVTWTKPELDAASVAADGYLTTAEFGRPAGSLSAAIDAATAPAILPPGVKRALLDAVYAARGGT